MKVKNIITLLLIFNLALSSFASAQIQAPETIEEIQGIGKKVFETGKEIIPNTLKRVWEEEVLPVWQKMYGWFEINIWSKVKDFFHNEIIPRLEGEYEKRKPQIEQEFEKEKQELKEELPELGKTIWERLKELWK